VQVALCLQVKQERYTCSGMERHSECGYIT